MSIRHFFFAGAVLAGVFTAATAQAQDARDASRQTRVVSYRDLDLSTPAGGRELAIRLHRAAGEVCDRWTAPFDRPAQEFVRRCMADAIGEAARKVERPTLTAALSEPAPIRVASMSGSASLGGR